jgi:hypothetical protein
MGQNRGKDSPTWKNGATLRNLSARISNGYISFRARVLRTKGNVCGECGKDLTNHCKECGHKPDRHLHHKTKFHLDYHRTYTPDEVIVLCESCHYSQHRKKGL